MWSDVARIETDGDALVIQHRNSNAPIVPARAFPTPEKRAAFEATVRARTAMKRNVPTAR